jgi:hypothetical protein
MMRYIADCMQRNSMAEWRLQMPLGNHLGVLWEYSFNFWTSRRETDELLLANEEQEGEFILGSLVGLKILI